MPILCQVVGYLYITMMWLVLLYLDMSVYRSEGHKVTRKVWEMVAITTLTVIATVFFFWLIWVG